MAGSLRSGRPRLAVLAVAASVALGGGFHAVAGAAEPNRPAGWCPVSVEVRSLDAVHGLYALRLGSFNTGRASGTIALYAKDLRYDIPFTDAVAAGWTDKTTVPTPIVVRFPQYVYAEGAYVSSLNDPQPAPCSAPFVPWRRYGSYQLPFWTGGQTDPAFLDAARAAVPQDAPEPVSDPRPCTTPDRLASTIRADEPTYPRDAHGAQGTATVRVVLNADDSVYGVLLEQSTQSLELDRAALVSAQRSRYRGATFRCKPAVGVYLFLVTFSPR